MRLRRVAHHQNQLVAVAAVIALIAGVLGVVPGSGALRAAAVEAAPQYMPMTPVRAEDTRQWGSPLPAGETLPVWVAGTLGVPDDAAAVTLNITAVYPAGYGFVTLYPCGQPRPTASTLNFYAGQTIANAAVAQPGEFGDVCLYTSAASHLIVDITGYFPAGAAYTAQTPARAADTRNGTGVRPGTVPAGGVLEVPATGRLGVPADAEAVALNITAIAPAGTGFITIYPCGQPRPTASTLNFTAGRTIANGATAKPGQDGRVCLYTSQTTHLAVDVTGSYPAGSDYGPLTPVRAADTRNGTGGVPTGPRPPSSTLAVTVTGAVYGIPADASAVVINITAVYPAAYGFVTLYPCGQPRPTASTLNYTAGRTIANGAYAKPGQDGKVCLFNSQPTHLIVDITGYFPPDITPSAPVTALRAAGTHAASITLAWQNPDDYDLDQVIVRRTTGTTPPATPTSGTPVPLGHPRATSVPDPGLTPNTPYSYAVFTRDQTGNTSTAATATATPQATGFRATTTAGGGAHTCGIRNSYAYCWGDNWKGQLGDGTDSDRDTPTAVAGNRRYTTITAGFTHTCALATDGKAWCWGGNGDGQLGDGTTRQRTSPVAVADGLRFTAIAAGDWHTCGLDSLGKAWCWGRNMQGQLGIGGSDADALYTPAEVIEGRTYTSITAGSVHTCALDTASRAWCWGSNDSGQLGSNAGSASPYPEPVSGGRSFGSIFGGDWHTCATTTAGPAYCWGSNSDGQLGDNTTADRGFPVAVTGGHAFTGITGGSSHSCAVDTGGRAWCWGGNWYGQLGDGGANSSLIPQAVAGSTTYRSVASGDNHTCGIDTAGFSRCWGFNYSRPTRRSLRRLDAVAGCRAAGTARRHSARSRDRLGSDLRDRNDHHAGLDQSIRAGPRRDHRPPGNRDRAAGTE